MHFRSATKLHSKNQNVIQQQWNANRSKLPHICIIYIEFFTNESLHCPLKFIIEFSLLSFYVFGVGISNMTNCPSFCELELFINLRIFVGHMAVYKNC